MHMNRPKKKQNKTSKKREREHLSYMQNSDTNKPKPIFSTSFRTLSVFFTVTVYLAVSRLCVCVCFYAKHYFSFAWHSIYYSAINGLNMISIFERGSQCFFFYLLSFESSLKWWMGCINYGNSQRKRGRECVITCRICKSFDFQTIYKGVFKISLIFPYQNQITLMFVIK